MEETNLLGENADLMSGETAPSKNFIVRNKRKFAGFTVVIVVVVLSLFDVWYGLVHNSNLSVDSAEVSFESNAQSDATLTVNGKMATQSLLHSLSIDDTFCAMQYSDTGDAAAPWQDLAKVQGRVAKKSNSGFELSITMNEVSYSPLRHLLSDAYWNNPTGLSVQCHAGVTLYLYRTIPVHLYTDVAVRVTTPNPDEIMLHYSSSGISDTGAFKFSDDAVILREDGDETSLKVAPLLRYMKKALRPIQKWINKHFRQVYKTQKTGVHGKFKNPFDTSEFVDSFIVKVPELSVATTLLGQREDGGRYHFSSTPFQVQLSQKKLSIDVDFSLLCSDAFDPAAPQAELHACDLFDAQGGKALWDTLNNGFLSIALDSAAKRNFLSELAGSHHSLVGQSVDIAEVEAKLADLLEKENGVDASAMRYNPQDLVGDELTTIQDPRISTGGKCVSGSADNIYDTYTCAVIEAGFFKFYLYIFDEDGLITKIQLLTSWAPSAPFASATQAVVVGRGGYSGMLNGTISELFQNASVSVKYNDNQGRTQLRSEAVAQWDLLDPVDSGMVDFIGYIETLADRADLSTGLTYGEHAYNTYLSAEYNSTDTEDIAGVKLNANGGYGGNYYNWHLSVDNAEVYADGQKQGDANSYLSSTVSTTGDDAVFQFDLAAYDGSETEQIFTENKISWSSPDYSWTTAGLIQVDSLMRIVNTIDWDADAALNYAEMAYKFIVRDVSVDETNLFLTEGSGNYGGNWNNWWADLVESSVTINEGLVGNATGAISAAVSSTGDAAVITFLTQAYDANAIEQLYTANNATWSSTSSWAEAGALAANSVFHLIDILDWNTHADFAYGDNAFAGQASDVDTEGNELFLVNGDGGYGGSWTHWWARLDNSALYLSESKIGSAVGTVNSYVDVDGLNGYVSLEGSVSDGGDEVVLTTLETAEWYSMNWDWLMAGQLNAVSQFNYPAFAHWNTTGAFSYGDHRYAVNATDFSANNVDKVFDLFGTGKYGGDWYNWYATLSDSFVYFSDSKFGSIIGDIAAAYSSSGDYVNLAFSTKVTDGENMVQVKTDDSLSWQSPSGNWLSDGDIQAATKFKLIDSVNWNADASFTYGDNQYSLFAEDYTLQGEMVFKADASGLYHGDINDFSATVSYSELYLSGSLVGTMVGNFGAAVTSTGDAADIVLYALVNDGDGYEQVYTNSTVAWFSPAYSWAQSGFMSAASGFRLVDSLSFNANGNLQYADHQYSFVAAEHQFDGYTDFLARGAGRYGGNWNAFWASLTESELIIAESLLGTATGLFSSEVTSNFDTGVVSFTALALDDSEVMQLSTNNTVTWESPIYDWVVQGNVTVESLTQVSDLIDWDASARLSFNDGTYTIAIADNYLDGTPVFLTQGAGTYGGTYGDWYVSVTESVCYIFEEKQGMANGELKWLNVDWFNIATLTLMTNVTDGLAYPVFYTDNLLTWYNMGFYEGFNNVAQGVIQTDTSVYGNPEFYLFSSFLLNQDFRNASFAVVESLKGEYGLIATASAFYDERFGMLTGINTKVSYALELLFEAHTSYDAQLETANFTPTMMPSTSPSEEPTAAPTQMPTDEPSQMPTHSPTTEPTQAPTYNPSPQPTEKPISTPTAMPTLVPTADPTVQPGQPTALPTANPTNPTAAPSTLMPTLVPTALPTGPPSASPTIRPSAVPSFVPTEMPSRDPTMSPSARPSTSMPSTRAPSAAGTRAPTRVPTNAPSAAPTAQNSPILSFVSNITLAGVTSPTLDAASQQAMITVTASSMGLPSNTVFFESSHSIASTGRRALRSGTSDSKSLFATYTVVAGIRVSVPLSSTSASSTDALYSSLTNQLTSAVTSGSFSTDLRQVSTDLGATETATASANSVSNGPAESTAAPGGGGSSDGLSAGAIAGIVIGVIAGLAIIAALAWYFIVQGGSPGAANAFTPGGSRSPSGTTASAGATAAGAGAAARGTASPTGPRSTSGGSSPRGSTLSNVSNTSASRSPKKGPGAGGEENVFNTENPLSSKNNKRRSAANVGDDNL